MLTAVALIAVAVAAFLAGAVVGFWQANRAWSRWALQLRRPAWPRPASAADMVDTTPDSGVQQH